MAKLIAHGHELARITVAKNETPLYLVVFADGAILIGARGRYRIWARVGPDNVDALGSVIAYLEHRYTQPTAAPAAAAG